VSGGAPLDDDAVRQAVHWYARLAELLADAGRRVGQLSEQLVHDWPDGHGREWSERASHIGSALGREAAVATELGEAYARQGYRTEDPGQAPPLAAPGSAAGRRPGIRIGGTDAARVPDERGMRIAELPTEPPG
jgi:hypothetical protein